MRPLVAHCHFGPGKLCRRAGWRHEVRDHLVAATTIYHMPFWLEQAEAKMRRLR